jgi:adenosylcobinamide kinase/adenosylcobinamide-phosphate guanylyltransferase
VIVTNEVGAGIIPANPLARRYADALGVLNQQVAAAADTVVLLTAGIATVLKPAPKTHEVTL